MPAYLTHWKILHKTVEWLEQHKNNFSDATMLSLAERAISFLKDSGPYPDEPVGGAISKAAHFGAVGPDYVTAAAYFAPDHDWAGEKALHDNKHGENSTNFILQFIKNIPSQQRQACLSYALGYMTHVAGDTIVHPYVNALKALDAGHTEIEVNQDSTAAQAHFQHEDIHSGDSWTEYLFDDDADIVSTICDISSTAFTNTFPSVTPPEDAPGMSKDFMIDGYETTANVVLDVIYDFSPWDYYWFLALILLTPIALSYGFFWIFEETEYNDMDWMTGLFSAEQANTGATISSIIFIFVIGGIFYFGIEKEFWRYFGLSFILPALLITADVLFKHFFPSYKEFRSRWWVRGILLLISLCLPFLCFASETTLSYTSSFSFWGFFAISLLSIWIIIGLRKLFTVDEDKYHWVDIILSLVLPWIWGFLGPIIPVAVKMIPPTDGQTRFSGNLGDAQLVIERPPDDDNITIPAAAMNLEKMIEKAVILASTLCMATVKFADDNPDISSTWVQNIFKNWNLNAPGVTKWNELMGTYDANQSNFTGDALLTREGQALYNGIRDYILQP